MRYTDEELKQINALIDNLSHSDYDFKEPMANRLLHLSFLPNEDEDEDWPKISISSLESLVDFFTNPEITPVIFRRPSIVLCDSGDLRAEWHGNNYTEFLGLEFIHKNQYKYVCFYSEVLPIPGGNVGVCRHIKKSEGDLIEIIKVCRLIVWI